MSSCPREILQLLLQHDTGVLATYSGESPYTSLMSIDFLSEDDCIVFPTLHDTHKYTNMRRDSHVSLLLDNRSKSGKRFDELYALTIVGMAREVEVAVYPIYKEKFLKRHPHLAEFLSNPQTALIQVTPIRAILVEEFQKIREFEFPPR